MSKLYEVLGELMKYDTPDREGLKWLRDRWDSQVINKIVIALNEGRSIEPFLEEVDRNPEIPFTEGRFDLRGIDLTHQNLRGPWQQKGNERHRIGVKLEGVNLTGSILAWAILPRATLRKAILKDADLSNAELIWSDFSKADLTGACFKGAWLLDTIFHDAIVTEEQLKCRRNLGQLDFDYHAFEI